MYLIGEQCDIAMGGVNIRVMPISEAYQVWWVWHEPYSISAT